MESTRALLYYEWMNAWNGKRIDLGSIFHPDVQVHQRPKEQQGIQALHDMISQGREPFDPVTFTVGVDPIVEKHMLAARWECRGTYRGGIPGVTADAGTEIEFGGMDIWRFEDDLVREYWVSSDGLWLMEQLSR